MFSPNTWFHQKKTWFHQKYIFTKNMFSWINVFLAKNQTLQRTPIWSIIVQHGLELSSKFNDGPIWSNMQDKIKNYHKFNQMAFKPMFNHGLVCFQKWKNENNEGVSWWNKSIKKLHLRYFNSFQIFNEKGMF